MSLGISCKCITYGRVDVLQEAIFSFLIQDYDGPKELVIINDYPLQTLKLDFEHPEITIINLPRTFPSIGEKDNFAVENCKYDIIAVWDDDDIALPNHLSNINKYFKNCDLMHWNRGVMVHHSRIKTIRHLGNSGIVYTKSIWEKAGGHTSINFGYDGWFMRRLKNDLKCRVAQANPPDEEVSWFYMWGGRSFHMSGNGNDINNKDSILVRHCKYIERLRVEGKIPTGVVVLDPKWEIDYQDLLTSYLFDLNTVDK